VYPVAPAGNPLRRQWGLEGRYVVGYLGNMGRAHEFGTMLSAARQLRSRKDILFLFIGDGPQRQWVETEVGRLALTNIRFESYQPRDTLALSLSVADVHLLSLLPALEGLVVPSKFYGIAVVGRPSIFIGDVVGEIPQLLQEADCGKAFWPGESHALARCIEELADAPERYRRMGKRARALFEKRFDKGIAMAKWIVWLESVMQAGSQQPEGREA
jgi:colanic acid biosynthesis glycosyl transferase WcaI